MMTTAFEIQPKNIASFISAGMTESAKAANRAYLRNIAKPGSLSESYLRRVTNDVVVDMILWRESGNEFPLNSYEQELAASATSQNLSV
jgi:hypothetical protein